MIDPASLLAGYQVYSTAKKWVPYAIGGAGGLLVGCAIAWAAWSWQGRAITSLEGQLVAMTDQRDVAVGDARRWEAFGKTAAAAVEARNAEIEAQRADLLRTELLLEQSTTAAEAEAADLTAKIRALKERANANPDQVRSLGPIALDAAKLLKPR